MVIMTYLTFTVAVGGIGGGYHELNCLFNHRITILLDFFYFDIIKPLLRERSFNIKGRGLGKNGLLF